MCQGFANMPRPVNARKARTIQDLHLDSRVLDYEISMLLMSAHTVSLPGEQKTPAIHNFALESFAVHSRALLQFLIGHNEGPVVPTGMNAIFRDAKETDILAVDFNPNWIEYCPPPSAVLRSGKVQADKQVAHMTIDRRKHGKPEHAEEFEWDIRAIVSELTLQLTNFLDVTDSANFDPVKLNQMKTKIELFCRANVRIEERNPSLPSNIVASE